MMTRLSFHEKCEQDSEIYAKNSQRYAYTNIPPNTEVLSYSVICQLYIGFFNKVKSKHNFV